MSTDVSPHHVVHANSQYMRQCQNTRCEAQQQTCCGRGSAFGNHSLPSADTARA